MSRTRAFPVRPGTVRCWTDNRERCVGGTLLWRELGGTLLGLAAFLTRGTGNRGYKLNDYTLHLNIPFSSYFVLVPRVVPCTRGHVYRIRDISTGFSFSFFFLLLARSLCWHYGFLPHDVPFIRDNPNFDERYSLDEQRRIFIPRGLMCFDWQYRPRPRDLSLILAHPVTRSLSNNLCNSNIHSTSRGDEKIK